MKYLLLTIALSTFITACKHEASDSTDVETSEIDAFVDISSFNGKSEVSVFLSDAVERSVKNYVDGATDYYYPDIMLSGGEYIEVRYGGERRIFEGNLRSPFITTFDLNEDNTERYVVNYYRVSGQPISLANISNPEYIGLDPIADQPAHYDDRLEFSWRNASTIEQQNNKTMEINIGLTCDSGTRVSKKFDAEDSGSFTLLLDDLFAEKSDKKNQICELRSYLSRRKIQARNPILGEQSTDTMLEYKESVTIVLDMQASDPG